MHQLRRGHGGALVLSGEPGVGKTALLDHVRATATDATVLTARGLLSEASLSFAGLGDLMRPLVPGLGALPEAQSAALSTALALGQPSGPVSGYAVCVATLNLLTVSAERRPVLVVVDDAHWLDAASATSLLFAARRIDADPVAVVFAIRPGESTDFDTRGLAVIELTGLDRAASGRLLDALRPGRVAAEVAEELWQATGGNPLALKEVAGRLHDEQLSGRVPLDDPLPVGRHLVAAFARRVDPLPEETRKALLVMALSASSDAHDLAVALEYVGTDLSALEPAEAARLIGYEAAEVMFIHPLIRAAVHEGAPTLARRQAYEALAATTGGEARAWYRAAGVAGTDEEAAQELEAAAVGMRRRTGFVAASRALHRAAELSGDREVRARRLLDAGTNAHMAGRLHAAPAWLDQARTLATDPLLVADIDLERGRLLTWRGNPAIAQQVLVNAANAASDLDRLRAAKLWCEATLPGLMEGRVNDAAGYVSRAYALLREVHDPAAVTEACTFMVPSPALGGEVNEARRLMQAARPYIDALDPVVGGRPIAMMALCHVWTEDYRLARTRLDGIIEAARRVGAPALSPRACPKVRRPQRHRQPQRCPLGGGPGRGLLAGRPSYRRPEPARGAGRKGAHHRPGLAARRRRPLQRPPRRRPGRRRRVLPRGHAATRTGVAAVRAGPHRAELRRDAAPEPSTRRGPPAAPRRAAYLPAPRRGTLRTARGRRAGRNR